MGVKLKERAIRKGIELLGESTRVSYEKSALESAVLQYTSAETDGGDALRPKAESREIAMRRVLRFVLWGLISVVALGGALFGYFVYSPAPEVPRLSGTLTKGTIEVGGLKRTYLTYVPRKLAKGAPLVVVMHGSDENGARIQIETGFPVITCGASHDTGAPLRVCKTR